MKQGFGIFSLVLALGLKADAQCDGCTAISGEIVDYCYQEAGLPGHCASFSASSPSFHYENKARKKLPLLQFPLPENGAAPSISYLTGLATDKKLKLSATDLLFVEHAVMAWRMTDGVSRWDASVVNSGFTILPSGLAYKILQAGSGNPPTAGKTVSVHYTGYLPDGKKFDSSLDRKQSFRFALGKGQVIKGLDEGVAVMPTGSRYLFRIPPDLATGSRGEEDGIPPHVTLFFDVQLLAVD
jgi:hypothetical protein